jgi:ribosome-associated protein
MAVIRINRDVMIDERELRFSYVRSPGPGGQKTNKTATKVILRFDVNASPSLRAEDKARIKLALSTRINLDGVLQIMRSRHRTQSANRRDALEAFVKLCAEALRPSKPRKATRPTRAAKERRLEQKRRRSRLKQQRRSRPATDAD